MYYYIVQHSVPKPVFKLSMNSGTHPTYLIGLRQASVSDLEEAFGE